MVSGLMRFFRRSNRQYPVYLRGVEGATGPAGPTGATGAAGAAGVGVLNYTTSEQDTGRTWTDGRTIFQRTFHFNNGPNNNTVTANHGLAAGFKIVKMEGVLNDATPIHRMVPNVEATDTQQLQIAVSATQLILASGVGGNYSTFNCDVTLWYVKAP